MFEVALAIVVIVVATVGLTAFRVWLAELNKRAAERMLRRLEKSIQERMAEDDRSNCR